MTLIIEPPVNDGDTVPIPELQVPTDPEFDYIYVTNVIMEKPMIGQPAFIKDFDKLCKALIPEAHSVVSKPIMGVIANFPRQLTDEELTAYMEGVSAALKTRYIQYERMELAAIERKLRDEPAPGEPQPEN